MLEIHEAEGVENVGIIKWELALCLLAVYLVCYFSLWKGISTSGKVKLILYLLENKGSVIGAYFSMGGYF